MGTTAEGSTRREGSFNISKVSWSEEESEDSKVSAHKISARQWMTMAVLVYVNLINYMDRLTLAGILEEVKQEFDANDARAGILQTAFILSYMLFAPLFGYLGDRYSRKYLMAAGVFLWSVLTLLGSLVSGNPSNHGKGWLHPDFLLFLSCRAMVGIGEASYSTIAPTLISDMFVGDRRSKMLGLFYFAIPVGSGLGYIVGSETARAFGSWQWGLRVTPGLGLLAVLLIVLLVTEPPRGASEGHGKLEAGSYKDDLADLAGNPTYIFTTLGFTCVTFCTGALSWWGPIFIQRGLKTLAEDERPMQPSTVPFIFGLVTMLSGIVGVPLGMILSTKLRAIYPRADPIICGAGILTSALFLTFGILHCDSNIVLALVLIFIGEVSLNLNWSIVADMVLYVVSPTCRGTAEAVQILLSHALGDAGSPYLIGLLSDYIYSAMIPKTPCEEPMKSNETLGMSDDRKEESMGMSDNRSDGCEYAWEAFASLQYSFFTNSGVEVLGGVLFLVGAIFIVRDRRACEKAAEEAEKSAAKLYELK